MGKNKGKNTKQSNKAQAIIAKNIVKKNMPAKQEKRTYEEELSFLKKISPTE